MDNLQFPVFIEDLIENPRLLGNAAPGEWYKWLIENGYTPLPLSGGRLKGIPYEKGGGFIIRWSGEYLLQYHPAPSRHNDKGAYFKLSNGKYGVRRFDLNGIEIFN